jgi:hypothetical protein
MRRVCGTRAVVVMLLAGLSLSSVGCDQELAAQMVSLSGTYVGDVVAAAATHLLQTAWGIDGGGEGAAGEGDDHDAQPLHEHEH